MKTNNIIIRAFIFLVFALGFVIYYMGYSEIVTVQSSEMAWIHEATKVFYATFSSMAMFTFNNDFSGISPELADNPFYLAIFWFVHSLAIFATFATVFLIFQYRIINFLRIWRSSYKTRYLLWGSREDVHTFIQNIRQEVNTPYEITVILSDKNDLDPKQLERVKVSYVYLTSDLQRTLSKLRIKKRQSNDTYLILMQKDYDENVQLAMSLMTFPQIFSNPKLHLIVNCDYTEWIDENVPNLGVQISNYNMADLISRQFIQMHPPYKHSSVDDQQANLESHYHALIIGFGHSGEQILLKLISQGQFFDRDFKVIVIEQDQNQNIGRFKRIYGNLIDQYNISFHMMDYSSNQFNDLIDQSVDNLSAIILCSENDQVNKTIGLELNRSLFKNHRDKISAKIFIKNTMISPFVEKINKDTSEYKNVYFFGSHQQIISPDIIINKKLDELATSIHNFYRNNSSSINDTWNDLTGFLKESNRHAAMHIFTKLGLIGLKAVPRNTISKSDLVIDSREDFLEYIGEERMQVLAKHEHMRWCAFHHINGWETEHIIQGKPIKDTLRKKHGCLVSWNELKNISLIAGEDYQASCVGQVENIYDYLSGISYAICKDNV